MSGPGRAIRWSTTAVVVGVAVVAAIVSYRHALSVIRAHGEDGATAYLLPLTVDGLIYAASMVMLTAARARVSVPPLARLLLGLGIVATLAANVMHGLDHGPIGALVAAWPAVALVGSYELLMWVVRTGRVREPDDGLTTWRVPAALLPASARNAVPELTEWQERALAEFRTELAAGERIGVRAVKRRLNTSTDNASELAAFLRSWPRS